MSDFDVVPPAVHQARRQTADVESELDHALGQLRHVAEELLAERWRGRAAATFEKAWSDWLAAARDVLSNLRLLGETLGETERAYLSRDDAQAGEFRLVLA